MFKDDNQVHLKTLKLLEESIIKDCDTGFKEEEPVKDNHDADVEEKKSITEDDSAAIIAQELGNTATKPDTLPHNEK